MFHIGFRPEKREATEEEYEIAKQEVANMLDQQEWSWLKARIADEYLSWGHIFQLVADII